jgi:hypothetical protein
MLTEVQLPNADGRLLPGSFARIHLTLEGAPAQLSLPSNALLFRSDGPQVGTVDGSGTVRLKSVKLGRDFGKSLEVISGLTTEDRVILNPSDSLADGTRVEAKPQAEANAAAAAAPAMATPDQRSAGITFSISRWLMRLPEVARRSPAMTTPPPKRTATHVVACVTSKGWLPSRALAYGERPTRCNKAGKSGPGS